MKAAVLDEPGKLRISEVPDPEPNNKEVLIKLHSCGICGSDVKIYEGHWTIPLPRVLGHEFSGEIVATGKEVRDLKVGDRVTVDPNEACGECEYCRTDRPHFCPNMIDHGILVDGGFADLAIAGEKATYKLPDSVSFEAGSFSELLSCCVHAINKAELKIGESVAVFGGGPAGQILHQLARQAGASSVTLFTHSKEKLELARKLGVTEALNPDDVNLQDFAFDCVIDAAGSKKVFEDGLKIVNKNGRFMLFGQAPEGEKGEVDLFNFLLLEASIIPTFINPFTTSQAVRLLESQQVDVESLISHTLSLDDIQKGFDLKLDNVPGTMKVLVQP